MSRLNDVRTLVAAHVTTAFTAASETVTLSADPQASGIIPKDQFPLARIIFVEEEPERLAFKQERRRIVGEVELAMIETTREAMNSRIEAVRDLIFADETLGSTVDGITAEQGVTTSSPDDSTVYGTLGITVEEVF